MNHYKIVHEFGQTLLCLYQQILYLLKNLIQIRLHYIFLILFYFGYLMVEEAFTKNYSTGTVWDPPLWIPYSSMMIGAALMILQYIAEIIKLIDEEGGY